MNRAAICIAFSQRGVQPSDAAVCSIEALEESIRVMKKVPRSCPEAFEEALLDVNDAEEAAIREVELSGVSPSDARRVVMQGLAAYRGQNWFEAECELLPLPA